LKIEFINGSNIGGHIPPMSLQLLIENAVKHNVVSPDEPLSVSIEFQNDRIIVSNNLNEKPVDLNNSTKSGLKQIEKRYELNKIEGFKISKVDNTYSVTLPIIKP